MTSFGAALKKFTVVAGHYDSHFLTFAERHGHEVMVRLVCLDPSEVLDAALSRAKAADATVDFPTHPAHQSGAPSLRRAACRRWCEP